MVVLSIFDGMSCLQLALNRIGIKPTKYFASEVDKYSMQVTMANFPDTIQLGDVRNVKGSDLGFVDLIGGGSPCQSFSFAGKRKGMSTKCEVEILSLSHYLELKKQNFEFEGQSYLFWEYMRILEEVRAINPNVKFLLENVEMGKKWEGILTRAIGIKAIHINSALVSAQNRKRIYFTNIGVEQVGFFGDLECTIPHPKDKGILLKDILENNVDAKYFISSKMIDRISRSNNGEKCFADNQKSMCLAAGYYKQGRDNQLITVHNTMPRSGDPKKGGTGHLSRSDGKTYCLDTGNTNAIEIRKDNLVVLNENQKKKFDFNPNTDKANCLTLAQGRAGSSDEYMDAVSKIAKIQGNIRRLTPTECERLQTVDDNYTKYGIDEKGNKVVISDTQRYKMLGNGWTIEVISHILSYLPKEYFNNK